MKKLFMTRGARLKAYSPGFFVPRERMMSGFDPGDRLEVCPLGFGHLSLSRFNSRSGYRF